jgi:hypothetical protein
MPRFHKGSQRKRHTYGVVVVVELVVVPPVELGAVIVVVVDEAFGPITCRPK